MTRAQFNDAMILMERLRPRKYIELTKICMSWLKKYIKWGKKLNIPIFHKIPVYFSMKYIHTYETNEEKNI